MSYIVSDRDVRKMRGIIKAHGDEWLVDEFNAIFYGEDALRELLCDIGIDPDLEYTYLDREIIRKALLESGIRVAGVETE